MKRFYIFKDGTMQSSTATKELAIDLHQKISEAREQAGLTTAQYITNLITEYFKMKENGGNITMANNNTRTLAFQIDETLFQPARTGATSRQTSSSFRAWNARLSSAVAGRWRFSFPQSGHWQGLVATSSSKWQ